MPIAAPMTISVVGAENRLAGPCSEMQASDGRKFEESMPTPSASFVDIIHEP
jgi:hypothetical protein